MTKHGHRARTTRVGLLALAVAACVVASDGLSQVSAQGFGRGRSSLTGTYQINTSLSDNSSTIADQVTRSLPGRDRPQLRTQILRRLDAPEELAIERQDRTITLASSSADRVTFEANGQTHTEQTNGRSTRTVANLYGDRLEINSTGDQSRDYQVSFEPIDGGRSLRVTRRVTDPGLTQPVVARSVYDRVSTDARLDIYGGFPNRDDRYARPRTSGRGGPGARHRESPTGSGPRASTRTAGPSRHPRSKRSTSRASRSSSRCGARPPPTSGSSIPRRRERWPTPTSCWSSSAPSTRVTVPPPAAAPWPSSRCTRASLA